MCTMTRIYILFVIVLMTIQGALSKVTISVSIFTSKAPIRVIDLSKEYPKSCLAYDTAPIRVIDLSKEYPKSCLAYNNSSDIHPIQVSGMAPFFVSCDAHLAGSGWTVIQRRVNGELNFYRNWTSYKNGFGNLDSEFFIGLDKLHAITNDQRHELYVYLEDFEGEHRYARYDKFKIANEEDFYKLKELGSYSGTAGDALYQHKNMKFTTYDRDNDIHDSVNCAVKFIGAWWYHQCQISNLNGLYLRGENKYNWGINWDYWRGDYYSYKFVQVMVRPKI